MILASQLTGCTVIIFSYFRNLTDSNVEITIKSKESKIYVRDIENNGLSFKNEIVKINRKTYKKLSDTLEYLQIDRSTIRLTIPPNSTVMLTPALKLRWYDTDFYKVILRQNENYDTLNFSVGQYNIYDIKDPEKKFKRTGGFVKNIFYYDYSSQKNKKGSP